MRVMCDSLIKSVLKSLLNLEFMVGGISLGVRDVRKGKGSMVVVHFLE